MAQVLFKIKIMPEDIGIDLVKLKEEIKKVIEHYKGHVTNDSEEEVAFGLKSLMVDFWIDDKETDSDEVEDNLRNVEGVGSLEILDIRRALG